MKTISKLSLNALKKNADSVMTKDELRSIKGGFQTCQKNLPDPYGNYCLYQHPSDPDCQPNMPRTGVGYLSNCYTSSGSYLGTACHVNGPCGQNYVNVTCQYAYGSNNVFGSCI
ncbi:hypothetical protein [Mucilaginibacter pedocola]|uniref:Uncharacterized protein n=1 Tax=Mucilaginibacter pedocola TaxID=1792845 RepID=A0A1S9P718_9SPHI|nr:hypothetical protein [Mucilaginibacter pedocola]OOQ56751.1 hypothetical protein BC343_17325 [Mucilaginibacter pedocola]